MNFALNRFVIVHLFHIIFVGGLFLYVGFKRNAAPSWIYPALVVLGIAIIVAHGLKILKNRYSLISWFHVLIVAPLVIYLGRSGPYAPPLAYNAITLAGILAIGDHAYWLVRGAFF
jgi:hypothetical protein